MRDNGKNIEEFGNSRSNKGREAYLLPLLTRNIPDTTLDGRRYSEETSTTPLKCYL